MKKGLMIYKSVNGLFNVGDYIQSLAAKQFLGDIDEYVCRENLDTYSGEKIKMIMNGWFTQEPQNWPPSADIHPLFTSFHINSTAQKELMVSRNIQYLKKYEPIGCRDKTTAILLKEYGVDSYFSGCLTLTLDKTYRSEETNDEILFVDPCFETKRGLTSICRYVRTLISNFNSVKKISESYYKRSDLKSLLKIASFFREYRRIFELETLRNGIYIQKSVYESQFKSEEDKYNYADYLLKKYARAKLIITSRIHCALPSIALETPIVFVENVNQSETSYCRLDGLRELFNCINYDQGKLIPDFVFSGKKISKKSIIKNKGLHLQLKVRLIESCLKFIIN